MEIVDYSDKSFAVIGDTKEFKDVLKEAGGRFNKNLTIDEKTVAGWIFSNSKREDVEKILDDVAEGLIEPVAAVPYKRPAATSRTASRAIPSRPPKSTSTLASEFSAAFAEPLFNPAVDAAVTANKMEFVVAARPESGWMVLEKVSDASTVNAYIIGGVWKIDPNVIPSPFNVLRAKVN